MGHDDFAKRQLSIAAFLGKLISEIYLIGSNKSVLFEVN